MNNEVVKCGLFLLGGIVIGAIGATAVKKGALKGLRPVAADVLSRGYDIREKVLEAVDSAREDVADVLAEAQTKAEARRAQKDPEIAEDVPAEAAEKPAAA